MFLGTRRWKGSATRFYGGPPRARIETLPLPIPCCPPANPNFPLPPIRHRRSRRSCRFVGLPASAKIFPASLSPPRLLLVEHSAAAPLRRLRRRMSCLWLCRPRGICWSRPIGGLSPPRRVHWRRSLGRRRRRDTPAVDPSRPRLILGVG